MQAVRVEHSYYNFPSEHKRRCYGEEQDSSLSLSDNSINSINELDEPQPEEKCIYIRPATYTPIDKSILHPGDLD